MRADTMSWFRCRSKVSTMPSTRWRRTEVAGFPSLGQPTVEIGRTDLELLLPEGHSQRNFQSRRSCCVDSPCQNHNAGIV
jgi:hypothetical protein